MKCKKCGAEIGAKSTFCEECGQQQRKTSECRIRERWMLVVLVSLCFFEVYLCYFSFCGFYTTFVWPFILIMLVTGIVMALMKKIGWVIVGLTVIMFAVLWIPSSYYAKILSWPPIIAYVIYSIVANKKGWLQ